MATSPPASPATLPQRPMSAMIRPSPRSNSRMSMSSKLGGGSRASDEDGRTAVKVAVRVRPPLRPTDPGFELIPQRFQRSMVQVTTPTSLAIDSPQGRKLFVFDRVFNEGTNQAGIWEYLNDSVNAFLQGYNVSLLAYGQSGAGKSYTMGTSGPLDEENIDAMGVIPRAATALFEKLDTPRIFNPNRSSMSQLRSPARYQAHGGATLGKDRPWSLKATYVEIYNEQLRDLLVPEHTPAHERGTVTIREDVKGNILLTGLRQVEINCVEDLMNALNFGSTIRQTDSTAINAKSSRSHAVFSLNLVQRKTKQRSEAEKRLSVPLEAMTGTETWVTTDSKLHFVDLAGSERLKNTGAQGERAKEGISINAGLAALGKVISQLSSRNAGAHVSYRDSKLTRLLQDSLGGNAITYMIACVTPAEFHLSETLNTVQYAQRARAIQSKPRIQAVEEGDKQGQIDRLKAEVAFLREQIQQLRTGESGGKMPVKGDRPDRSSEREVELQNQLLDAQENYSALSQRHARLIAEIAKARDDEIAESQQLEESLGDSATERLNRSNSFAQAVEQVVLEYEKTIQSLEQSLSSTRSTLSSTETFLLEKETKCAYVETLNTQLQARLQKMVDREASTENYLHDLESKLDGHTSGEEKNATIIIELRKEIARVRENEASCEDYISTLEERLAEADQDAELMQREIDRLEQVIERQRSLGKLDSLLHELDHIQDEEGDTNGNGVSHQREMLEQRSRSQSHARSISHRDTIPEIEEEEVNAEEAREAARSALEGEANHVNPIETIQDTPASPAQTKFVADKLESVTQELVDLRVEHESTLNEFDLLHAKYDEALRTLAELQDAVDEARHPRRPRDSILSVSSPTTRPSSYMSDPVPGVRSLSSELSSAMESPVAVETSDAETVQPQESPDTDKTHTLEAELGRLQALAAEKESTERELAQTHVELERLQALAAEKESTERELAQTHAELERLQALAAEKESTERELAQTHAELERLQTLAAEKESTKRELAQTHIELERLQALVAEKESTERELAQKHAELERLQALATEKESTERELAQKHVELERLQVLAAEKESTERELAQKHAELERLQALAAEKESTERELAQKHAELGRLQALAAEKESMDKELAQKYAELEAKHHEALDLVEELKTEVAKAKTIEVTSPRTATPVIRRKSSQNMMVIDRAHRSFASLRNIATENFEEQPDVMQNFELNLNAAMHELHARSERIQELEADVANAKKEMETKMTIISGLTRERSSLKSSPMEMSMVSTLRDQLEKNERQLNALKESHAEREKELLTELEKLRALTAEPTIDPRIPELESELDKLRALKDEPATDSRIPELEAELAAWESRHQEALNSLQATKAEMNKVIEDLESQVAAANARLDNAVNDDKSTQEEAKQIQVKHQNLVNFLRSEIDEYKAIINSNAAKVAELERAHASAQEELEEVIKARNLATSESDTHKMLVAKLTAQIADHEQTIKEFEENKRKMEAGHAAKVEELKAASAKDLSIAEEQVATLMNEHSENIKILEGEVAQARESLTIVATQVAVALGLDVSVEKLTERIESLIADRQSLTREKKRSAGLEKQFQELTSINDHVLRELEAVKSTVAEILPDQTNSQPLIDKLLILKQKITELETKNKKNSRIVEELEEQLATNYDQAQITNNRLSTLTERNAQLEDANTANASLQSELATIKEEYAALQAKYDEILPPDGGPKRTNSGSIRKSSSVASLPSPPPSVPLPPLPGVPQTPTSIRPPSKDLAISQIQEDQEARIRTIEKHLTAEKQLTQTLEEALTDLEKQSNKVKADADAWRRKCMELEAEIKDLKDKPQQDQRWSLQAVEEERKKRLDAELARARMEERMNSLNKKKKKGSLNCF